MEEKLFTLEQIAEQFQFDFTDERKKDAAEVLRNNFTKTDAAEMAIAIGRMLEEHTKKCPEEAEAVKSWNFGDRFLWQIKETYVMGVLEGLDKAAAANKMGLVELRKIAEGVYT